MDQKGIRESTINITATSDSHDVAIASAGLYITMRQKRIFDCSVRLKAEDDECEYAIPADSLWCRRQEIAGMIALLKTVLAFLCDVVMYKYYICRVLGVP